MIRVLIVDDHPLVRQGLRTTLRADDVEIVAEAADGIQALQLSQECRPDVVLMDLQMPGMDGIEATRLILAEPQPPAVVVLTMFDLDHYVYRALRAGATGFLLKNDPPDDLLDGVRRAARGGSLLGPSVTRRLVEAFVERPVAGDNQLARLAPLTDREREVLRAVGRGGSNSEIAAELFLAEATVRTHLNRIFSKLGLRDRAQAVIAAYEAGLVKVGEAE